MIVHRVLLLLFFIFCCPCISFLQANETFFCMLGEPGSTRDDEIMEERRKIDQLIKEELERQEKIRDEERRKEKERMDEENEKRNAR